MLSPFDIGLSIYPPVYLRWLEGLICNQYAAGSIPATGSSHGATLTHPPHCSSYWRIERGMGKPEGSRLKIQDLKVQGGSNKTEVWYKSGVTFCLLNGIPERPAVGRALGVLRWRK